MTPLFRPIDSTLEKVSELIDNYNWTWNAALVRTTFSAPDAEAILNIPLRNGGGDDFLAWAHDKTGIYSVKTVYRALRTRKEQLAQDEGEVTGTSTTNKHMRNALLKLNVMPKVRVFWWRAIRGILPDESTLKRRYIKVLSRCNVCHATDEDLMHALIYCSHAKQFWIKAQYRLDVRLPRLHPLTWTRDIVCDAQFSVEERAKIISVMWSIWHSHNRWTHDSEGYNPSHAIRHIRESLALLECYLVMGGGRRSLGK